MMPSTTRRHLNMTRDSVAMRQDLAASLRELGFSFQDIGRQCGYVNAFGAVQESSVRGAIRASRARAAAGLSVSVEDVQTQRRFGVEIECFGLTQEAAARALTLAGVVAAVEGYSHSTRSHWKVITDSSVNSSGTGCGSGLEIVSPILVGDAGIAEMQRAMKALREAGARVDRSCGMHVHHDANDLTPTTMARFVSSYIDNQGTIDRFVAPSRRTTAVQERPFGRRSGNRWCQPVDESEKTDIVNAIMRRTGLDMFDRYRTINITSFPRYGTVEIRQHQGSLDGRKAAAWVRLGQALVRYAVQHEEPLVATDVNGLLHALCTDAELPRAAANYLRNRAGVLASPLVAA